MSDLKLRQGLKIVLTFSAGMDTVTLRTSILELPTGQEHLCQQRGGGGNKRPARGREGNEGRNALDMLLWAQCTCKTSTYTLYYLSRGFLRLDEKEESF